MEFVEYKEAEVAVDGVADVAFLQSGQQEFEHHVVGEDDCSVYKFKLTVCRQTAEWAVPASGPAPEESVGGRDTCRCS